MSGYDITTSVLAGMDEPVLRALLSSLQASLVELMSGSKVAKAAYTQGNGARSVEFTQADLGQLRMLIREVQAQLGIVPSPRRAIGVNF
ncbi:MAG: hypothetical protein KIS90_11360 [Phenylobacterium sp.]|nr:hypothetical protein [Phenylobacterium sp.]